MAEAELSIDDVRRVALLARLALREDALEGHRDSLRAVLGYVETLRGLNVEGVEPLSHPESIAARLDLDAPRPGLPRESLLAMAPEIDPPFVKVPKVLGESSS